jgi:hypothetical protein
VSTPDKPDHARGWLYVEKLLDEADDERIKKLSDEELRAEIRQGTTESTEAEGNPATEWSADDFLARAEALAAKEPKPAEPAASATAASEAPAANAPAPETPTTEAPAPPVRPPSPSSQSAAETPQGHPRRARRSDP